MADICKLASSATVIQSVHLRLLGLCPNTQICQHGCQADAGNLHGEKTGTSREEILMPAPKSADLSWLPDHFCVRSGWLPITFTAVWLTVLPEILNR